MTEDQKIIQDQQDMIAGMQEAFREIGNFADGLDSLLVSLLQDVPEGKLVNLTLKTIMKIVERNI